MSVGVSRVHDEHGRVVDAVAIERELSPEAVADQAHLAGDERFNEIADRAPDPTLPARWSRPVPYPRLSIAIVSSTNTTGSSHGCTEDIASMTVSRLFLSGSMEKTNWVESQRVASPVEPTVGTEPARGVKDSSPGTDLHMTSA